MLEDFAIDIKDLQIKLPPAVRAVFEPVSGMMIMNATDAEFDSMRSDMSDPLAEVFAHEMYHCFQAYTTGYSFARVLVLTGALSTEYVEKQTFRQAFRQVVRHYLGKLILVVTGWLPKNYRFYLQARHTAAVLLQKRAELQELNAQGQPSFIGASYPSLYRKLTELKKATLSVGKDGLSANDLLECSAAVYARLSCELTPSSPEQLLEYLEALTETYSRSLRKAFEICGDRAIHILLLATALALRYERPENAFCELVRRIAQSVSGDEVSAAKKLAADLPSIEEAGAILGTAADVRTNTGSKHRVYAEQMDALAAATWGIDELDLLSDPQAIAAIPPGSLGFGIRTLESVRGPGHGLPIAAIMLRGGPSLHHLQTESSTSIIELSRSLLGIPPRRDQ